MTQGFGSRAVGAPYAVVPPNSELTYDLELLRLSNIGPDALTRVCPTFALAQPCNGSSCTLCSPVVALTGSPCQ